MELNVNPVPAVIQSGLDSIELLKWEFRKLKQEIFGPGCNAYDDSATPPGLPRGVRRETLERRIDELLTPEVLVGLAAENAEARVRSEEVLGAIAMEEVLQSWMPDSLVLYSLRVEGRNRQEMLLPYRENERWGYYHRTTPVAVLPAREWPSAWKELVFLDARVDEGEIAPFMPDRADYLLSTVHKFEVVDMAEGRRSSGNKGVTPLNGGFYRHRADGEGMHWRAKSGSEGLWKAVALVTGIEEKPGEPRESIVDTYGIRLLCSAGGFGTRFAGLWQAMSKTHALPDLREKPLFPDHKGALILNTIPREGYEHSEEFLKSLPQGYKGFCRRVITQENRSIRVSNSENVMPYYLEMLVGFGSGNERVFDRNVADVLLYPNDLFKAIYREEGFDPFAYKARNEGWRVEHYTMFEWLIASRLAHAVVARKSRGYVDRLIEVRMQQAVFAPTRRSSALSAQS